MVVPPGREDDGRRRRRPAGFGTRGRGGLAFGWNSGPGTRRVASRAVTREVWVHGVWGFAPAPEPIGCETRGRPHPIASPWVRLRPLVALGFIRAAARPPSPSHHIRRRLLVLDLAASRSHPPRLSSSRHPSPWVIALSCPGSPRLGLAAAPLCSIYDPAKRVLLTCFLLLFVLLAGFGGAGKIKIGINGEFLVSY